MKNGTAKAIASSKPVAIRMRLGHVMSSSDFSTYDYKVKLFFT
jgi:hypothetical protein